MIEQVVNIFDCFLSLWVQCESVHGYMADVSYLVVDDLPLRTFQKNIFRFRLFQLLVHLGQLSIKLLQLIFKRGKIIR